MAAAEYYTGAQRPQQPPAAPSPYLAPPQPQRASSNPGYAYQQHPSPGSQPQTYFPPPPYQDPSKAQVHFAQSPRPQNTSTEHRNSFSHPQRPTMQQRIHPYPPQNLPPFAPQNPAPWQHQQNMTRPFGGPNQSETSLGSGYSSDPEYHRRRHRHRHHHSDEGTKRDGTSRRKPSDASRSTTTDGLIGATGGGLLGDLIFPGLGTVGGALAGWIGGKDYGKYRQHREEKLHKEQEKWERRYGSRNLSPGDYDSDRDRSKSRDRRRRRSHE